MPKNKTHSGASKRFKVTGSGKIMRLQAGRKSGAAFASAPTTGSRKKHRRNAGMVELEKADVEARQEDARHLSLNHLTVLVAQPPSTLHQGVTPWHASSAQ